MFYTMDALMNGNPEILKWYANAKIIWQKILKDYTLTENSQFSDLSKDLFAVQSEFEHECGGRSTGKEIMAISGILQFYSIDTGFEERWDKPSEYKKKKAKIIYNSILFSGCSVEVKMTAKRIAKNYGLVEE